MDLKEWALQYLRHRDIFHRKIVAIEDLGEKLQIRQKDGDHVVAIVPKLELSDAPMIMTENRQENLDFLLANWEQFTHVENQKIIFANPRTNEKWIICPSHHAKIAEPESLKMGLEAMFSEVAQV